MKMDALIYSADNLIAKAKKKITAFKEGWVERGTKFSENSMPEAALNAARLVKEANDVCRSLEDTLESNKLLLEQDKILDVEWDKLEREEKKKKKMYA